MGSEGCGGGEWRVRCVKLLYRHPAAVLFSVHSGTHISCI